MVVGGLGLAALASNLQRRKAEPHGQSEQGDPPLMKAAIGVILAGIALLGIVANIH
jgi:hypothetical protein